MTSRYPSATLITPEDWLEEVAGRQARGNYQQDVVSGQENVSGSSLTGSAKTDWGGVYSSSRGALYNRLRRVFALYGLDLQIDYVYRGSPLRYHKEWVARDENNWPMWATCALSAVV